MRIYIVRHGDPNYEIDSLTERGFKEARILSDRLIKMNLTDFYCSPLGRAQRTSEPTMERYNKPMKTLTWLREFEGKIGNPHKENELMMPWNLKPNFWMKEKDLYDREGWRENPYVLAGDMVEEYDWVTNSFDELLLEYGLKSNGEGLYLAPENPDKNLVFFCHFALGLVLVSHLTKISPFLLWQNFFKSTSSVTSLVTEERVKGELFFKCVQLGDTSHLYAADQEPSPSGLFPEFYRE